MNYLIVDDEPLARRLLQAFMEEIGGHQLKGLCASPVEAVAALQQETIDLILLDIKMPVISGIDFLRSLKSPPLVIFTTAHADYALHGYELDVVDYLLKPISLSRLRKALEKAMSRNTAINNVHPDAPGHTYLKVGNQLVRINFSEILLIEGMQNYVRIHLPGKVIVAPYTMKGMEDLLPKGFIRVHRSFIVPQRSILSVKANSLEMAYQAVPIGVTYRETVLKYLSGTTERL